MCQLQAQKECSVDGNRKRPCALVVDDNPVNRLVLRASLFKLGIDSLEAENGLQAVELLGKGTRQLSFILLDLQMPVLDGWETARHVRAVLGLTVPILACTAANLSAPLLPTGVSVQEHALNCGADVCLTKPLQLQHLTAALQQLCIIPLSGSAARQHAPGIIAAAAAVGTGSNTTELH